MNLDLEKHLTSSRIAWTSVPLPSNITTVPKRPFTGISKTTIQNAPPQLLAHILRTSTTRGTQVVSPKATPMRSTVQKVDPYVRQAGHIVVTTQAHRSDAWPTVDGRSLAHLFPAIPNKSDGSDTVQVTRTATKPIGVPSATASSTTRDPVSKAIMRAAALIDIQRRPDVAGDADKLAEVLDTAWSLPRGVFGTLAPLVLANSQDLLRTAISSDHNAPDALMPIQHKKFVHAHTGVITREVYGSNVGVDWARQRAVSRAIYFLSMKLESVNFFPTNRTYPAADMTSPIHSSQRDKVLVFQPGPGSFFRVDPGSFAFFMPDSPPARFRMCDGTRSGQPVLTGEALESTLAEMVAVGLPIQAASVVRETFMSARTSVVVAGSDDGAPVRLQRINAHAAIAPDKASIAMAKAELTDSLLATLARGKNSSCVIRSRIMDVMTEVSDYRISSIFKLVSVLKTYAPYLDIPETPYALLRQLASRLSYVLGEVLTASIALEAQRHGVAPVEWFESMATTVPRRIRPETNNTLGWSTIATWCLWDESTPKWSSALRRATRSYMLGLASMRARAAYVTLSIDNPDVHMEAAKCALNTCKDVYAPYYESSYDVYALLAKNSPMLVPLGVGNATFPAFHTEHRTRRSVLLYTGALFWQLRGRILRSAFLMKIGKESASPAATMRRLTFPGFDMALCIAPNKAYEALRIAHGQFADVEGGRDAALPRLPVGNVLAALLRFEGAVTLDYEDHDEVLPLYCRVSRYAKSMKRFVADVEKTFDEVVHEVVASVNHAIMSCSSAPPVAPDFCSALVRADLRGTSVPAHVMAATTRSMARSEAISQGPASVAPLGGLMNPGLGAALENLVKPKLSGFNLGMEEWEDMFDEVFESMVEAHGSEVMDDFMGREFSSRDEFMDAVDALENSRVDQQRDASASVSALTF